MSFWSVDDKIPVRQTKVSIPAENGLEYDDGQKINFIVPPTITYFQPKESYLELECKISTESGAPFRATLDPYIGGQVLVRDIRIHSGGAGAVLLEEIQNYNTMVAVKYCYESNDNIRAKRALTEGSLDGGSAGANRASYRGGHHDQNKTHIGSPWSQLYRDENGDPIPQPTDQSPGNFSMAKTGTDCSKVKLCLPLHTGIFSNSKVFPALLTEGLRIEIILEDAVRCVKIPDVMNPWRDPRQCLRFHSLTGREDQTNVDAGAWTCDQGAGNPPNPSDSTDVLYVARPNDCIDLDSCPFVIGQQIGVFRCARTLEETQVANNGAERTFLIPTDNAMIIKELEFTAATGADNQVGGRYGLLKITLTQVCRNIGTQNDEQTRGQKVRGNEVYYIMDNSVRPYGVGNDAGLLQPVPKIHYHLSDVKLVLQQIDMPQGYTNKLMSMMKGGGTMNYDFLSSTNYKYSQIASDVVSNIRLPLSQSRAKSILSVPTDASVYLNNQQVVGDWQDLAGGNHIYHINSGDQTAWDLNGQKQFQNAFTAWERWSDDAFTDRSTAYGTSITSGITGIWDMMTDYQWFYDGKLNPSRKVGTNRLSILRSTDQQAFIELEKALAMAGIEPLSFKDWRRNAVIGRALALQDGCYDCRGRDFNLQVNYQDRRQPQKNKLWHNFVFHLRRIEVKGDQISVQV